MSNQLDEYRSRLREALGIINDLKSRISTSEQARTEAIAIIGIGCRFPGDNNGPDGFWNTLEQGIDPVREIPEERWPRNAIPGDRPEVRWAALLDDIGRFDAEFFGISPREAVSLDPQQRLLLEVAWEALENSGELAPKLMGTRTGVFLGLAILDYQQRIIDAGMEAVDTYSFTGNLGSTAAGRLSFVLGLQGPCVTIDTACSSSLVAIHQACQSLRNSECEMALAGGVNAIISPYTMAMLSQTNALAPDGRCKTFDARANGYVRGEGCGVIILKKLSAALRDGNRIRALIRGSAVNQDGRSTGLTTPNVLSQKALLRQALENARLTPDQIGYIELHGTGTPLGDPIEFDALKAVIGAPRPNGLPCILGALKTNVGHLEGAAGIAGVIKMALALEREKIPRNLHFRALNPRIDLDDTPFVIPSVTQQWRRGQLPRIGGVNSFGISGTNAHIILEEAPLSEGSKSSELSAYLVPISAKSAPALARCIKAYDRWCSMNPDVRMADIVQTAALHRTHYEHRLAAVAQTPKQLEQLLESYLNNQNPEAVFCHSLEASKPAKIVFVFPGQGSQWLGMGRELFAKEAVFRQTIEACDLSIKEETGVSIIQELNADEETSRMSDIDVVQPLLFAIEVALAALWESWGIVPDCVVGHSMGEVAAAYSAGMLTLTDAVKIICRRSQLLKRIRGNGAMALVELSMEAAEVAISNHATQLSIAVSNGPRATVISGFPAALDDVIANLEKKGVFVRKIKVDVASHSPQVDPLLGEIVQRLTSVRPTDPKIDMYSTVTGRVLTANDLKASYWSDNLRQPVRFSQVTRDLIQSGHRLFVEISPHPVLLPAIEENLKWVNLDGIAMASMLRQSGERATMLEALGKLYVHGRDVEWRKIHPEGGQIVSLPAYQWERERFWIDTTHQRSQMPPTRRPYEEHPLLGIGVNPASQQEFHIWEQRISIHDFPYLADHRVQNEVVFPGAGYVEMMLAAGRAVYGEQQFQLATIKFEQILALAENEVRVIQVAFIEDSNKHGAITISSRHRDSHDWVRHASGSARIATHSSALSRHPEPEDLQVRCPDVVDRNRLYALIHAHGITLGDTFRGVIMLRASSTEIFAHARLPDALASTAGKYLMHPAMLDAMFQPLAWLIMTPAKNGTFVPVMMTGVELHKRPGADIWIHGQIVKNPDDVVPTVSFSARDEHGQLLLDAASFRMQLLESATTAAPDPYANCAFQVVWRNSEIKPTTAQAVKTTRQWLVVDDAKSLGKTIAQYLRAHGDRVVEVIASTGFAALAENIYAVNSTDVSQWQKLLTAAGGNLGFHGIIDCLPLSGAPFERTTVSTLEADIRQCAYSALCLTQAILRQGWRNAPRLYLLTRGAQAVESNSTPLAISQSLIWGLGRVIAIEQPDLGCVRIDLPSECSADDAALISREVLAHDDEDQIAYRSGRRYVARLIRGNRATEGKADERLEPAAGRPYQLVVPKPGVWEKLTLRPLERKAPSKDEVEIEVVAAGLNFLDLSEAMGVVPDETKPIAMDGLRLGRECAGRVVGIGAGITDLEIGQEVIALGQATMATHTTAQRPLVITKPRELDWNQAATIPIVFLTAYHALAHVARLQNRDRILIHDAADGVGMAALQWAQHVGAEIFVSAGNEEKRAYLRNLGLVHVFDSTSLSFVDDTRRLTNGQGVDVVLNSLSGKFLDASLELLRDYGRFIDIGKRDVRENQHLELGPIPRSLSFSRIDIRGMILTYPEVVSSLLREVFELLAKGVFKPLPGTSSSIAKAREALDKMARAQHVGTTALTIPLTQPNIVSSNVQKVRLRDDGTYLISGGLGGLGLSLAQWMVDQGVRSLVLVGRSAPNAAAESTMAAMRAAGATVHAVAANVAQFHDVNALLNRIAQDMPPLRGVVHGAAVLADRTIHEMREHEFFSVMEPKVLGAWNLHVASQNSPLDFFVMYSSAAGVLGSPGQANYVAANTFLDALSQARHAAGLPATSIQWGAFADIGLAALSDLREKRVASRGSASFKVAEGHKLFTRSLELSSPELCFMHFDVQQWIEFYPQMAGAPFVSELMNGSSKWNAPDTMLVREQLGQLPPSQRLDGMKNHLTEHLAKVLRLSAEKIDERTPFTNIGIDSLLSIELRNRLEATLGMKLSATLLFTYSTTATLATYLLAQLFPEQKSTSELELETLQSDPSSSIPVDLVETPPEAALRDEPELIDMLEAFEEYLK